MRIKKLELKNFRGFEDLAIDFPEGESGLAVFVGVNGSGKTSVLEGVVRLLKPICDNFLPNSRDDFNTWMNEDDIRTVAHQLGERTTFERMPDYKLSSKIKWDNSEIEWHWTQSGGNNAQIRAATNEKRRNIQNGKPDELPIIAYYKSNRYWSSEKINNVDLYPVGSRLDTYSDCLDPKIGTKVILEWFKRMEFIHFKRKSKMPAELEAVKDAISLGLESMLKKPSGSRVEFSGETDELLIMYGTDYYFPFRLLSEGFRSFIGMIGDIAYRAAELNPHVRNETSGIIAIDDIDLHLHPSWQRQIIPTLRYVFPNIQFILTTHSPQVLSNVPRENVFVLEDFKLVKHTPHTFGRDSNSILWELFGVRERPEEAQKDFSKLSRLLNDPEKEAEAKELLTKLSEKYGKDDSEVVRARLHLEFLTES